MTIADTGRNDEIVEIAIAEPDDDQGERAAENAEIARRAESLTTKTEGVSAAATIMANPDETGARDDEESGGSDGSGASEGSGEAGESGQSAEGPDGPEGSTASGNSPNGDGSAE